MNKVDLIIPTFNRTDYLRRILDYYLELGVDFNYIIADSSNQEIKRQNKKLINKYTKLNILYVDKFSDKLIQSYKFAKMVQYAKSKYVIFCADDDFIIPNAIRECVKFLENHPDYSAAHGSYIGFHLFKNQFLGTRLGWDFRHSPASISFEKPAQRLKYYLLNNSQVLWSVRRTNIVKTCYKELLKTKFDPYLIAILGEMLPDALTVIFGKVMRLNTLYGARQYFGSVISYYPSFFDTKRLGKYNIEYEKFKSCLIRNLKKVDNTTQEQLTQTINTAMKEATNLSYQQHFMNKIHLTLKSYPQSFYLILKALQAMYLFSKKKTDIIGKIDNPSSKFFNDFDMIKRNILNHSV